MLKCIFTLLDEESSNKIALKLKYLRLLHLNSLHLALRIDDGYWHVKMET